MENGNMFLQYIEYLNITQLHYLMYAEAKLANEKKDLMFAKKYIEIKIPKEK